MIMRDLVTDFLMKLSRFTTKDGSDIDASRELASAINAITGEESLDTIYVNTTQNYLIPDVAVLHLYHKNFSSFILNPDIPDTCPFGYTLEIHNRTFKKYTTEELGAAILHDILQNVQSDTAKIRFLRAYRMVTAKHDTSKMLSLFDDINLSEVSYIMFTEICLRPFKVPVMGLDYNGTDDVLKAMGLGDAYDSYLEKALPKTNMTVEKSMEKELEYDIRDVNTIINACLDNDIRHYYSMIRDAAPLVSLQHVLVSRQSVASIGFISRRKDFKRKSAPDVVNRVDTDTHAITETYNDPKTELDIRFQMDKIISDLRYAETEGEREVILVKIRDLSLKLYRMEDRITHGGRLTTLDKKSLDRLKFIHECQDELEELRKKTVTKEIKVKRWSVYAKDAYPEGYDF